MANPQDPNDKKTESIRGLTPYQLPPELLTLQQQLTELFLTPPPPPTLTPSNVQSLVTGVGIIAGAPPVLAVPPSAVLFVQQAPDCELQPVYAQAQGRANALGQQIVVMKTARFLGQAAPGDSISPFAPLQYNVPLISAGTLGALGACGGSQQYLLSANHVLAYNGRVPLGTAIVDPGTLDDPNGKAVVGSLSNYVPLQPAAWPANTSASPANRVDLAWAEVTTKGSKMLAQTLAAPATPLALLPPGTPARVRKTGRTTHTTTGTLCLTHSGFLDYSFGTFYFDGLMGIIGDGPGPFAAPGDSGASVITDAGQMAGLVMARAYCSAAFTLNPLGTVTPLGFIGYVVLACPATAIQSALAARLDVPPAKITFIAS